MVTPAIVAVAARTPVGLVAEATAAAIRAGVQRLVEHPFLSDGMGDPLRCGSDPRLDPYLIGPPRIAALAQSAVEEIVGKLGPKLVPDTPLIVVLPERRPGFDDEEEAAFLAAVRSFTQTFRLEIGPRGHAGPLAAIVRAQEYLRAGKTLVVVLAADSYLDPETLRWLDDDNRLPGDGIPGAFPPGEAGVAFALGPGGSRVVGSSGPAPIIRGVGVATDARTMKTDEGLLGEGLSTALRTATAGLRLPNEAVDDLYGDLNGEPHRADDFAFALLRFPGFARKPNLYTCTADCVGDVGAASAALGCVLAVRSWARKYASGPRALIWAGSDGGLRAAAVLQDPGAA